MEKTLERKLLCLNLALLLLLCLLPVPAWAAAGQLADADGNTSLRVAASGQRLNPLYTEDGAAVTEQDFTLRVDKDWYCGWDSGFIFVQPDGAAIGDTVTLTAVRNADGAAFSCVLQVTLPWVGVFSTAEYDAEYYICDAEGGRVDYAANPALRTVYLVKNMSGDQFTEGGAILSSIPEVQASWVNDRVLRLELASGVSSGTYRAEITVDMHNDFMGSSWTRRFTVVFTDGTAGTLMVDGKGQTTRKLAIDRTIVDVFFAPDETPVRADSYSLEADGGHAEWAWGGNLISFDPSACKIGDTVTISAIPKDGGQALMYTVRITAAYLAIYDAPAAEEAYLLWHSYNPYIMNYIREPGKTLYVMFGDEDTEITRASSENSAVRVQAERTSAGRQYVAVTLDASSGVSGVFKVPLHLLCGEEETVITINYSDGTGMFDRWNNSDLFVEADSSRDFGENYSLYDDQGRAITQEGYPTLIASGGIGSVGWDEGYIILNSGAVPGRSGSIRAVSAYGKTVLTIPVFITVPHSGYFNSVERTETSFLGSAHMYQPGRAAPEHSTQASYGSGETGKTVYYFHYASGADLRFYKAESDSPEISVKISEDSSYLRITLNSAISSGTHTATIHYEGLEAGYGDDVSLDTQITFTDGIFSPETTEWNTAGEPGKATARVLLDGRETPSRLLMAVYDAVGRMAGAEVQTVPAGTRQTEIEIRSDALREAGAEVRLFWLDGAAWAPLAERLTQRVT